MMDFYELTMANGYFEDHDKDVQVAFDVFYRQNPDEGGFAIFAGLEQVIEYVENMTFTDEDVEYFRQQHMFSEKFLAYLKDFRFKGDIYALPEGTVMYPNEPILTVVAPLIDAQLVETAILAQINHQSLIATKARRICPQYGCGDVRRARCLHRRRRRHGDVLGRQDVRHPDLGYDGAQLGHVLWRRVRGLQKVRGDVSGCDDPARRHVRCHPLGHPECHPHRA